MQEEDAEFVPTSLTVAELDERLQAATGRRVTENAQMREETRALQELVARKQHLVARLEATLVELEAEQEKINTEVRRLLTPEEQARFVAFTSH